MGPVEERYAGVVQVTDLFRRGVVSPLDEQAETQLRTMFVTEPLRVEFLPFVDNWFGALWHTGVFGLMNQACGSLIDEYEEELLELGQLELAIGAVRKCGKQVVAPQTREVIDRLCSLLEAAQQRGRPVLFVL